MSNQTNLLERYFKAYNARDPDAIGRLVTDAVTLSRPGQSAAGRDELLEVPGNHGDAYVASAQESIAGLRGFLDRAEQRDTGGGRAIQLIGPRDTCIRPANYQPPPVSHRSEDNAQSQM